MKSKLLEWFAEVWLMVVMWWQVGLVICLLDGFLAYLKINTMVVFILATCQALLLMFFIVPLMIGTILFFSKRGGIK